MGDSTNNCIGVDDILSDFPNAHLQKRLPSYIKPFLLELQKEAVFIHKSSNALLPQLGNSVDIDSVINNDSSPDLDVTGSPLNFTKYSVCLDDTVLHIKKSWSDDEEKHLPISLENARSLVSQYLIKVLNCHVPMWVVCDGSDASRTLLLCAFKEEGWCSRSFVQYKGLLSITCVDEELGDTCSLTSVNKQNSVDVHCVCDLSDDNGFEDTLNLTENEFVLRNCSKMLIELQWHYASLKIPSDGVSTVLVMDLNIGHKSSAIFSLWSQLNLLSTYYEMLHDIICDKQSTLLSNSSSCDEVLLEKISTKVLASINSPEDTVGSLSQVPGGSVLSHEKSRENVLAVLIKQVVSCMRPNCDVTDRIWLLLNDLNNIRYITTCLNNVFSELGCCKSKTQADLRNKTLLSNIINASLQGNLAVTEISVEKTLEVMIETGIEKLKQDYIYVFKKLGVECSNLFKNSSLSIAKSLDVVKYNMNILAQMHVALDFILGVQFRFNMREQNLIIFAESAFKKSCEIITSLNNLQNNPQVSLEVPVTFESIVDHLPSSYSNLKLVSSSKSEEGQDHSILLLTSQPIFPPSLMQFDNKTQEEAETTFIEQQYHVYKLSCFCDYVGKQ